MENIKNKKYFKWIIQKNNILKLVLSLLIAVGYAYFYPFANYDPGNTIDRYEVGIVDLDNTNLSKNFIQNLEEEKKFKPVNFDTKEQLEESLKQSNNVFLGIIVNKGYKHAILNVKNFEFEQVKINLIENTKKNQMVSTINANIKTKVNEVNSQIISKNVGHDLQKNFTKKVKNIHKIIKELKSLYSKLNSLDTSVNTNIDYYTNLISKVKLDVEDIKQNLNNQFLKDSFNNLSNEAKNFSSRVKGLSKEQLLDNISAHNFTNIESGVNSISDPNLRKTLQGNINTIKSVSNDLLFISKNLDSKGIHPEELIQKLNRVNVNAIDLSKYNLNHQQSIYISDINKVTANLKKTILLAKEINTSNLAKIKYNVNNLNTNDLVSSLTNLNINEVKGVIDDLKNPKNKQELNEKIDKAKDGIKQLSDGVKEFEDKDTDIVEKYNLDKLSLKISSLYSLLLNPSIYDTINLDDAQVEGIALIGFGLMLGMWILCLFTIEIVFNDSSTRLRYKYLFAFMYIFAYYILHIFVIKALDWKISNTLLYMPLFLYIGYVFYTIQRMFYKILGKIAPLMLTLIFIVQVTASGATIPIELMNHFYQNINDYIPLKYGTNIIREMISDSNYSIIWENVWKLSLFAIVSHLVLLVTTIKGGRNEKKSKKS